MLTDVEIHDKNLILSGGFMIKHYVKQWEENKEKLESVLKTIPVPSSYKQLVELIFEHVLKYADEDIGYGYKHNPDEMTIIDNGDYQGTQIFIIPFDTYQPGVSEYVFTSTYYGSCSGCDTLQAISCWSDETPNKQQLEDLMTLCLHLVQNIKYLDGRTE